MSIPDALLWHPNHPNLYKVEVILKDKTGKVIDDYVTTTGIRTITQERGKLYINNQVEMLNGAQILSYRYPIETIAKTNRCVSDETIIQDLLQIKKMNGNMLRIHVHAEKIQSMVLMTRAMQNMLTNWVSTCYGKQPDGSEKEKPGT